MDKKYDLAELYFQNHSEPSEKEFMRLAKEKMFFSYLNKSLGETRKKYLIRSSRQNQAEVTTDFLETYTEPVWEDTYDYDFLDIISCLTERQQEYMRLSFLGGYSDRQIASIMKIKPQSVHDIKTAAFKNLRKELSDNV
ncbi:MAG: hypothetical protein LUI12_11530 [Clostridiales bacterium]|nr:hypothetical protein [Clostridiales bacterium]